MNDLTRANAVYRDRLEQALRVMQGLSETERSHFDMDVFAVETPSGIRACIAGFCGFDPWFRRQGLETRMNGIVGNLTINPRDFFGTARLFFPGHYRGHANQPHKSVPVSYDEAIRALKTAIREFADEPQIPVGENEPETLD